MNNQRPSRRDFLKSSAIAGVGLSLTALSAGTAAPQESANAKSLVAEGNDGGVFSPRPAGQRPVHDLTTRPLERVRAAFIGLNRGMTHVSNSLKLDFVDVVAVCDLRDDRARRAAKLCSERRGKSPEVYSGTEHIWE